MKLKDLLLEAKYYDGANHNTPAAWLRIDKSETNSGKIQISDKYGSFNWQQNKSNDNVSSKSRTGSGDGKGFSFYFARYSYSDPYFLKNSIAPNKDIENRSGSLARIQFSWLMPYLKDPNIKSRLSPDNAILVLINDFESSTIISATFTTNKEKLLLYSENFANKLWENNIRNKNKDLNEKQLNEYIKDTKDWLYNDIKGKIIVKLLKQVKDGTKEFIDFIRINN